MRNAYSGARDWLINDAISAQTGIAKAQADNRLKVEQVLADEIRNKTDLDRARTISDFLNKQATPRPADAPELRGRAALQQQVMQEINQRLGLNNEYARAITPEQLAPMLRNGEVEDVAKIYGRMAPDDAAGYFLKAKQGVYDAMARNDWQGDVARASAVTAATGGAVAGLTAAGQGLMQLMAYLQQGMQTEKSVKESEQVGLA